MVRGSLAQEREILTIADLGTGGSGLITRPG